MFNLAPALCALGLLAGCATAPSPVGLPDLPGRTLLGYQCSDDAPCGDDQRCYKRFPNSTGRCVYEAYWESHPRGCATDQQCQRTEICDRHPREQLGRCSPRFGALAR